MSRTFPLPFPTSVSTASVPAKPGLFSRLLAKVILARQLRAERELARYLDASGLKFTDSTEREIERRLSPPRSFNADHKA